MRLLARTDAHEGPVYVAGENALYYTTSRPRVDIRRLDLVSGEVRTVRSEANMANGMTLAPSGELIVCEQGTMERAAAITRVAPADGSARVLVDSWQGAPLNSPNDVVVASDGAVWFTDPSYGHLQGFRPQPWLPDAVYRFEPRGRQLTRVADDFDKPNGLAFSPDESILYVGDSERRHVKAYDVAGPRELANPRIFCEISGGYPDGLKVDADGRVYTTAAGGVQVFSPDGELLDELPVPGAVNFAFAGDRLLITADDAIWSAPLTERSARWISSAHAG
jgi:gluconolactonase